MRLGNLNGIKEIIQHAWFRNVDFKDFYMKKVKPPFVPNILKFNFDDNDLIKGELEIREKIMGKVNMQEVTLFKEFYFDSGLGRKK